MDWNSIMGSARNAMERKMDSIEKNLRNKARGYSDDELIYISNKPDLAPMARDIIDDEMARRGL